MRWQIGCRADESARPISSRRTLGGQRRGVRVDDCGREPTSRSMARGTSVDDLHGQRRQQTRSRTVESARSTTRNLPNPFQGERT